MEEKRKKHESTQSTTDQPAGCSSDAGFLGSFESLHAVNSFRKRHGIRLHGGSDSPHSKERHFPVPLQNFDDLKLYSNVPRWIFDNIKNFLSYTKPTPIQMQAIPIVLTGQSLIAVAPTGSGKTIAFLLPLLCRLKSPGRIFARVLVICPSRELAQQMKRESDKLIGGKKFTCRVLDKLVGENQNIRRLDLAISTPLKLIQFCRESKIKLDGCECLVLDEADRLLDSGFSEQVDEILSYCHRYSTRRLQMCLLSATMAPNVLDLAMSFMPTDTTRILIGVQNAAADTINQSLVFVTKEEGKLLALRQLVKNGEIKPPTLIFVQTRERAQHLFNELIYDGIYVDVINSERTNAQRDAVVEAFRTKRVWILICTDLMARGVDFKNVELVINYDFPQSATSYIHRIGRTGRARREGRAITFYSMDDLPQMRMVVNVMRQSGCDVADWMLKIAKPSSQDKKRLQFKPPKRKRISTTSGWDLAKRHKKRQLILSSLEKRMKTGGVSRSCLV